MASRGIGSCLKRRGRHLFQLFLIFLCSRWSELARYQSFAVPNLHDLPMLYYLLSAHAIHSDKLRKKTGKLLPHILNGMGMKAAAFSTSSPQLNSSAINNTVIPAKLKHAVIAAYNWLATYHSSPLNREIHKYGVHVRVLYWVPFFLNE